MRWLSNIEEFNFIRWINSAVNVAEKTIDEELDEIAQEALNIAQQTIIIGASSPDFTQAHGNELAEYIVLKKSKKRKKRKRGTSYTLVAGEGAPPKIKYELYYAEYGAGVTAEKSSVPSPYEPKGKANKFGVWEYEDFWGSQFTDRSIPLRYMRTTRKYVRNEVKNRIVKQFKTNVKNAFRTSIKRG